MWGGLISYLSHIGPGEGLFWLSRSALSGSPHGGDQSVLADEDAEIMHTSSKSSMRMRSMGFVYNSREV